MDPIKQKKLEDEMKVMINEMMNVDPNAKEPEWEVPEGFIFKKQILKTKNDKGVEIEISYDQLTPKVKNDIVIIQCHGGAYIFKLDNSFRTIAAHYSKVAGGAEVFTLDYRIDKFPSALEDAVGLYNHLLKNGYDNKKIILAGDSAGGNLVLVTTLYLKEKNIPLPNKLILMSPWANAALDSPSRAYNMDNDIFLGSKGILGLAKKVGRTFKIKYFEGVDVKKEPLASPMYGNYKGFPKTLIQAGGYELILDDAKMVAEKAKKDGCNNIKLTIYDYMCHDFQIMFFDIEESKKAWEEIKQFINE